MKICILLTTYNREKVTMRALDSIDDENLYIDYLVVDDDSSDGTRQAIRDWNNRENPGDTGEEELTQRRSEGDLRIIRGSGSLYWAGGMRKGMEELLKNDSGYDYLVMINDDVVFYPGALTKMIGRSKEKGDAPVSGAVRDSRGRISYGGVVYDMKKAKPTQVDITEADTGPLDAMNCNCFLLPWEIFRKAGAFDPHYVHSLADYDYGFRLKCLGVSVWLTAEFVGECDDNDIAGTWRDRTLPRLARLKKKEAVKGLPRKQWYYYLKKNFGLSQALWHSLTPYIRILLGM